jgi:hypothetical protein
MVKSIIVSLIIFCYAINSYSSVSFNGKSYRDSLELKREIAVQIAESFNGIEEIPNNKGFKNKKFEQAMRNTGWKTGNAWCAFVLRLIYNLSEVTTSITGWSPTSYNKKNVVYTDGKFLKKPMKADAVSYTYLKFKKDKSRYKGIGHTGLLMSMRTDSFIAAEGNTSDSSNEIVREGDVFTSKKIRPLNNNTHITRWIGN